MVQSLCHGHLNALAQHPLRIVARPAKNWWGPIERSRGLNPAESSRTTRFIFWDQTQSKRASNLPGMVRPAHIRIWLVTRIRHVSPNHSLPSPRRAARTITTSAPARAAGSPVSPRVVRCTSSRLLQFRPAPPAKHQQMIHVCAGRPSNSRDTCFMVRPFRSQPCPGSKTFGASPSHGVVPIAGGRVRDGCAGRQSKNVPLSL